VSSDLVMRETPKLNRGSLVIGLSGWGNAGSVSTLCLTYIIEKLDAVEIGEIIPGKFYDYNTQRPHVSIEKGVIKEYDPPRNLFYYSKAKSGCPALLLLKGTEPHIDWSGYARSVLEAVEIMGARRIYMIGSYVGDVPHTVEPVISVSAKSAEFLRGISHLGMQLTDYDGPTGVYSEIIEEGHKRGIDAMSIWGAVPPYVEGPDPKVAFHILEKIVSIIGVDIPLLEMKGEGEDLDEQIAEEAKQNPDLRRLISSLEIEYRAMRRFDTYLV
jgi:proteasome assembly chaperone (PAC2) family protein